MVRQRRLSRRWRWALTIVAGLVVLFIVATALLFVWPPLGGPRKADAIVSLNGAHENLREDEALSLARRGYAPTLLFSQGRSDTTCPVVPRVMVVCFVPNPGRTIGEAEWAANYARRHHLRSLLVVAGQTQAVRALLLVGRCFHGDLHVVGVDGPKRSLPYDIAYGWGALGKALVVDRHC